MTVGCTDNVEFAVTILSYIKQYFFPKIDKEVQSLTDADSMRNIEHISPVVAFFEFLTLAVFILTTKSFGVNEWHSIESVIFCIGTCIFGYAFSKLMLRKPEPDHMMVMIFNAAFYLLMSTWGIITSIRRYVIGEQILTFYAVQVMMVCFIVLKPWLSIILTTLVSAMLYVTLYMIDQAAGLHILNYIVFGVVSMIGLIVRFHSITRMSETTVQLRNAKNSEIQDKINILQGFADIYDNVNLIDFTDNTEMSMSKREQDKQDIVLENKTHTIMSKGIRERIIADQQDSFIEYTDISTVRSRLLGKRLLSEDFLDVIDGWIRAQYIPLELDEEGLPLRVIFTTRNVDEERKREERLLRIAMTDELTHLRNRRSYEEELTKIRENGMDDEFVIMTADVNGLKNVNDTKGHVAGDELIKGAAECLLLAIGNKGDVYRVGGDEFAALIHTDAPQVICKEIEARSNNWHGKYSGELSISIGYAAHNEDRGLDINGLEKKADNEMYQAKAEYYKQAGKDRRGHRN